MQNSTIAPVANLAATIENPRDRLYDLRITWGPDYDQSQHICYVSGQEFVRARCDRCVICVCTGYHNKIELVHCRDRTHCNICHHRNAHGHAIVIATAGVSRQTAAAGIIAACGIFFNVDSWHNNAFKFFDSDRTLERAKLFAVITALKRVIEITTTGGFTGKGDFNEVIIKTSYGSLVRGMTSWVVDWRNNGWRRENGRPLNNGMILRDIDGLCQQLHLLGLQVRFWHVPFEQNQQANKLANAALSWQRYGRNDWFPNSPSEPFVHP